MKSDAQLQNEIQAEINTDPKIAEPGRIGVAVRHGVAKPTDAEIADAVATLLEWSAVLDAKDVHATVEGGWVTLEGVVRDRTELSLAERLAARIRGVAGVSNRIRLGETAEEKPIAARVIEEAFDWHAVDQEC